MSVLVNRIIRADKRGYIEEKNPILERLGLDSDQWITLTTEFEQHFCYAAGREHVMRLFGEHTKHKRTRGMGKAKTLLRHT